jgi:single-strand DNA-binding protein
MPSYNRVILIGRLTREPELKYTSGGLAVTTFSIAVDRRFKNQQGERQTDFFRCKAWRQKAEFVANYVTKGRLVAVDGSIETSEVTGQDGQKRYFTDIVCENVEILESQRDNEGGAGGAGGANAGNASGNYGGANAGGGGASRGQNAAPADDGGGYFPDEDAAPAATPPRANARPQGGGQGGREAQGGGNSGGGNQARGNAGGGNAGGNRPAPTPAPAYPEDDFDDSDPFADQ